MNLSKTLLGRALISGIFVGFALSLALIFYFSFKDITKRVPAPIGIREKHVVIVLEENHSYAKVMGDTQDMPYLNALARSYAYSKNYFANTHPSIGNYFVLTSGNTITNNSKYTATVPDDNIVRHLIAAGKTWKEYSGGLPTVGFTGSSSEPYDQDHNPLAFFSAVRENPDQANNYAYDSC